MKKTTIIIFLALIGAVNAQDEKKAEIKIDSRFTAKMVDPVNDLRKVNILVEEKKKGALKDRSLVLGGAMIALFDYQRSNTDSKFGYMMRHPTSSNQIGKEVSEAVIHSFHVSMTGSINNWLTFYSEMLYDPQQSFGTGTITTLTRNQIQLRKGFLLLGDLNKFPVYGALGKMDAPFGQTGSVSPFTNSSMWHAFGGLGYGAQLGFKKWNIHATFMAVQGGAQFRAMNTPVGDSTNVPSQLNNFVGDLNYMQKIGDKVSLKVGGSYIHGCAYCQEFPVQHFEPCKEANPAYTVYARLDIDKKFVLKGGFAKTLEVWKGTHNPIPPLDVWEASKVSSIDYGASYTFNPEAKTPYTVSAEFSNFRAGPVGSPWERQNQAVAGFSALVNSSSKLFVELFRTDGYVPLNWISGSNAFAPFPPGETHSALKAFSYGIVVGGQIVI